jgi:hypothetical protein
MKSLVRTISVLALISLFAVSFSLAEDSAKKANDESAESNVEQPTVDIEAARALRQAKRRLAEQKRLQDKDLGKRREVLSKYRRLLGTRPQSRRVLVIPATLLTRSWIRRDELLWMLSLYRATQDILFFTAAA